MGTQTYQTYADFFEAFDSVDVPDEYLIGAFFTAGTARYFTYPASLTDGQLDDLVFELKHGRPRTPDDVALAHLLDQERPEWRHASVADLEAALS